KGDVIALARNATAVDFAYRIHTEVGNHMKGARVNDRWTTLDQPLKNGDIVEISTSKNSHPSLDWLNYAATPSARNRIRQWFKKSHREENIVRGRKLLEEEMGKSGFEALLKSDKMQSVAERCNYQTPDDLLAALGYGEVTINAVANKLRESSLEEVAASPDTSLEAEAESSLKHFLTPAPATPSSSKSPILGVEGLMYHLAGCCSPLPGEPIVGAVTRLRGISIHCQNCTNVKSTPGERLLPVSWNRFGADDRAPTYPVALEIDVIDRVGIFRDILGHFSDRKLNVLNAGVKTSPDKTARISVSIEVRDARELAHIQTCIRQMSDVFSLRQVAQAN
ncbi:MAG: TGS domain-containing protein, partial [Cyanobacteria bacterium J06641_5]